jgi:hypothetical protein
MFIIQINQIINFLDFWEGNIFLFLQTDNEIDYYK